MEPDEDEVSSQCRRTSQGPEVKETDALFGLLIKIVLGLHRMGGPVSGHNKNDAFFFVFRSNENYAACIEC